MKLKLQQWLAWGRDAVQIIRVGGWLHFLGLYLLGYAYGSDRAALSPDFGRGLVATAFFLSFTFAFNNLYDRGLDNLPKNPLARDAAASPRVVAAIYSLGAVSLILAGMLSQIICCLFLFMLICSWLYSGAARIKKFFVIGTLFNVPIFLPLFLAGIALSRSLNSADFLLALLLGYSILVPQLAHELQDQEEDRRFNIRTIGAGLGRVPTLLLIILMSLSRGAYGVLLFKLGALNLGPAAVTVALGAGEIGVTLIFLKAGQSFRRLRLGFRFLNIFYGLALLGIWLWT